MKGDPMQRNFGISGTPLNKETRMEGSKGSGVDNSPKGRIGSEYRKAEYDAKGWAYDDTIEGYNRDGSKISIDKKNITKIDSNKEPEIKRQEVKKDKKKFKDTKVGKFLGTGQSEKRKARRADLREKRGDTRDWSHSGRKEQLKKIGTKIKSLFGGNRSINIKK